MKPIPNARVGSRKEIDLVSTCDGEVSNLKAKPEGGVKSIKPWHKNAKSQ